MVSVRCDAALAVDAMRSHALRMSTNLQRFLEHLRGTRAPRTVGSYWRTVQAFARFIGNVESPPTQHDVERFLARPLRCGRARSAATRNQELAAMMALSTFSQKAGDWSSNPTCAIAFAKEPIRDPVFLSAGELRQLFELTGNEADAVIRARDLAIIALLSQAGLRVHELVALNVDQVVLETGTLLAVSGKGGACTEMPMSIETALLLRAWLAERSSMAMRSESALFVSRRGRRMSIRCVERVIERLRLRMGSQKRFSPHSLRHTMATLGLYFGSDLATVGELLRHSSLDTTRRYVHLLDERRREAVARLAKTIPLSVLPAIPMASHDRMEPLRPELDDEPRPMEDRIEKVVDDQRTLDDIAMRESSARETFNSAHLRHITRAPSQSELPRAA